MLHRICGASVLSPLAPGKEYRPALDEAVGLGWNCVRVFCGVLPWAGQELAHVYDRLPAFLAECSARGLNAYLAYHTEAGTGYNLESHTDAVEGIARANPVVVLREVANEADHPTQGDRLPPERCLDLADRMDGPHALGATITDDESDLYCRSDIAAVHLDRGGGGETATVATARRAKFTRDTDDPDGRRYARQYADPKSSPERDAWNMARRVREIYAHCERHGGPATNQEPIGAAEHNDPGRRCNDPAIFYTLAALGRLFDLMSVFHSDDGLNANTLGPTQYQCATAFANGFRVWPNADVLAYKNAGHDGSPVNDANFDRVVRVYSGLAPNGGEALTVALGLQQSIDYAGIVLNEGWRWDTLIGQMTGADGRLVQCWRTAR